MHNCISRAWTKRVCCFDSHMGGGDRERSGFLAFDVQNDSMSRWAHRIATERSSQVLSSFFFLFYFIFKVNVKAWNASGVSGAACVFNMHRSSPIDGKTFFFLLLRVKLSTSTDLPCTHTHTNTRSLSTNGKTLASASPWKIYKAHITFHLLSHKKAFDILSRSLAHSLYRVVVYLHSRTSHYHFSLISDLSARPWPVGHRSLWFSFVNYIDRKV